MIDAWFNASDSTRTSGPPSTLSAPRLAAKPVGKQTAASVPFHSAKRVLQCRMHGSRTGHQTRGARAGPPTSEGSRGGRDDGGMCAQPEVIVGGEGNDGVTGECPLRTQGVELAGLAPEPALDDAVEPRPHPVRPDPPWAGRCGDSGRASALMRS